MSIPNKHSEYKSLHKRSFSLPILTYLSKLSEVTTFGTIMKELNISKRGLALTLEDLEDDGLIEKSKVGRNTLIVITPKGRMETEKRLPPDDTTILEEALNSTVLKLEKEGIIDPSWSPRQRNEFIDKLKTTITEQIQKINQF